VHGWDVTSRVRRYKEMHTVGVSLYTVKEDEHISRASRITG
jgi:hypothetical protein